MARECNKLSVCVVVTTPLNHQTTIFSRELKFLTPKRLQSNITFRLVAQMIGLKFLRNRLADEICTALRRLFYFGWVDCHKRVGRGDWTPRMLMGRMSPMGRKLTFGNVRWMSALGSNAGVARTDVNYPQIQT